MDYLVKPFRKAEVLAKMKGYLRLQGRLRQLQGRAGALEREIMDEKRPGRMEPIRKPLPSVARAWADSRNLRIGP